MLRYVDYDGYRGNAGKRLSRDQAFGRFSVEDTEELQRTCHWKGKEGVNELQMSSK